MIIDEVANPLVSQLTIWTITGLLTPLFLSGLRVRISPAMVVANNKIKKTGIKIRPPMPQPLSGAKTIPIKTMPPNVTKVGRINT